MRVRVGTVVRFGVRVGSIIMFRFWVKVKVRIGLGLS